MSIPSQAWNIERNVFAIVCGAVAYMIPNNKSNIHPVLMGIILSILSTKVVYGDYDKGYQWSINDIYFGIVVGGFGALGAYIVSKKKVLDYK
jgi:hypothetical protein